MYIDAQGPGNVHVWMQVPQYVILVSGEVMVSITGIIQFLNFLIYFINLFKKVWNLHTLKHQHQ